MKKFLFGLALVVSSLALAQGADFYSNRLYIGKNLKAGYALENSGFVSSKGKDFPNGFQFFHVVSFELPRSGGKSKAIQDLNKLSNRFKPFGEKAHLILTSSGTKADRAERGERFPNSWQELSLDSGFTSINQNWRVWLDTKEDFAELTAATNVVAGRESRGGVSFFGCAKDGKVMSVYRDYLLYWDLKSDRLESLVRDCLAGKIGASQVALGFQDGREADFTLRNENGVVLKQSEQKRPFALMVSAPDAAYRTSAKAMLQTALQTLREAKIPVYVLALEQPKDKSGQTLSAEQVAKLLRSELSEPVYEDVIGNFLDRFSNYLMSPLSLILFNAKGIPVDGYFLANLPDGIPFLPNSLAQGLLEYGLQ